MESREPVGAYGGGVRVGWGRKKYRDRSQHLAIITETDDHKVIFQGQGEEMRQRKLKQKFVLLFIRGKTKAGEAST